MIYSVTKKYCSLKTCRIRISIFLLFNGFVLSLSASPKQIQIIRLITDLLWPGIKDGSINRKKE